MSEFKRTATTASTKGLPTALFVGPQKAGTSWIHEYLQERNDICLPRGVKETFFFDDRFDRKGLEWYASHFSPTEQHRHVVEVAPTYFHSVHATDRVGRTLGQIPIVVTLREPVARAYSLYLHLKRYGFTDLPLREAVQTLPDILQSGRYAEHLERWIEAMGRSRVHVLFQEDLACDAEKYASKIDQILGLEPPQGAFDFDRRVNEAAAPRSGKLAGWVRQAGDWLRDHRLYWPIEMAKKFGAKQLVYSGGGSVEKLTEEDRQWLAEQFREESLRLRQLLQLQQLPWDPTGSLPARNFSFDQTLDHSPS